MKPIPNGLKVALYWFVDAITKGLLGNENWDFDPLERFDSGELDWQQYQAAINHPTIIKTVYTIWMNNIQLDDEHQVVNKEHACFRAFQYLRTQFDSEYRFDQIDPPFTGAELGEAQY
jgi:hypothetical protein